MKDIEDVAPITPVPCEERGIDPKWKDKIIIIRQEDVIRDDFKEPKKYYIINGWGDRVYIKTIRRSKAQEIADEIWGKGFYQVKQVIVASVR